MSKNKKLTQIKSSVFSRSLSLAKLGVNVGLKYASTKISNTPFEEFINTQAHSITKEFGELKGSVMKAGQMLSVYGEHFFPPEATQVLKTLQSDSPSIEWPVMREYISEYLDQELLDELEINPDPIGSASMGQVHLAIIKKTHEKIALKIQYPDVDKAIDSDVAALKRILSLSKILPAGVDLTNVFEEIKTMLRQELDYVREAEHTQRYYNLTLGDDRFVIPKVFSKYSNNKVLATEYIEGLKPDHQLIQSLSDTRRNRLAANFLDLYFKEIFDWSFVQTDPHIGNYKIQIDSKGNDRLVLLDFGATKQYDSAFISSYKKLIKGAVFENETIFTAGATELGFIIKSDPKDYIEAYKSFCYEMVEPFKAENTYSWKNNDLPKRIIKKAMQFKNYDLRSPPQDIIFLDRKTAGVFTFLAILNADINARRIIEPYLLKI